MVPFGGRWTVDGLPEKASCQRQYCDLAWSWPALRPGTIFAGIASTDAPQCNASHRRWHHFPGCSSGHHFLGCTSQHHFPTKSASPPAEGSLASDLRAVFHPREAGIATWHDLCQPCVPARYLPALRPLMLLSAMRPTEGGITSPDALPGITSWDVLPSITSRRSRPRLLPKAALRLILERFFIPAKRALRPGMIFASLASRHDICRHCVH